MFDFDVRKIFFKTAWTEFYDQTAKITSVKIHVKLEVKNPSQKEAESSGDR